MIKSSKSTNVVAAVEAKTANAIQVTKVTLDFLRKTGDAKAELGTDDGSTFTAKSSARISFDLSDQQVADIRSAVETAMKKKLSEDVGFQDGDTTIVARALEVG